MKQLIRLSSALILLLLCGTLFAQTRIIKGNIKDEKGMSIPYATVQVKGTTIGTYTDTAGNFVLGVDSSAKTLLVTLTGYKPQEVAITDNMNLVVKQDVLGLSEVVITAVGITYEKRTLGYATQTVGNNQLNNTGTSNMLTELDGKVAGLQVISSSGDPGAGTYINLRGPTSLTGNNQPLIVVDGIPIDNSINVYDPTFVGFGASGAGGELNGGTSPTNRGLDINPSDIESITVLKGPAATALYGIAAANGALIVTTKKGQKNTDGSLGIEYNSSLTFSTVNKLPDYQNQYSQGTWTDANLSDPTSAIYQGPTTGQRTSWGPKISTLAFDGIPNAYDVHGNLVPSAPGLTPAIAYNPYDFFQTGVATDNNISFSGGSDRSTFRVGIGYLGQKGVIPLTSYGKANVNLNGQTSLGKKLKISAGINYVNSINNKAQQGNNVSGVMFLVRTPPTFDNSYGNGKNAANVQSTYLLASDSERDYRGGTPGYDNPYWTVNENTFVSSLNRISGQTQLDYDLLDWMKITYRVGADVYAQDDKNYINPLSNNLNYEGGGVFISDYINTLVNSDFIVNMTHKIGDKFKLNVVLGQNYYTTTNDTRLAMGTGLTLPSFPDLANATSFTGTTEGEVQYRRSAWYGQAVLGYADQLFLTLSGRDETTSTLSPDHDVFFYPSADLGWVFTETFKMSTNKILPYGKLRVSYAIVGQDAPAQSLTTPYRVASVADGYSTGNTFPWNGLPGYSITSPTTVLGNPGLLPQNTYAFEVGTDLAFFQNRISLSATYYSEDTKNEILTVPIPLSSGFAAEELNAGEITNKGIEITLNTTPIKSKKFQWDLGINWSHNDNKVVKLAQVGNDTIKSLLLDALGDLYDVPGYPVSEIYGTDYVRTSAYDPANPTKGLVLNDQGTPATNPGYGLPMNSPNAPTALAKTQPTWIGGLTTSFTLKTDKAGSFALGAVMSIREGGYMWDGTQGAMQYYGTAGVTENRGQAYQVPSGAVWGHLDASGQIVHYGTPGSAGPELSGAGASVSGDPATYSQYYYQNLTSIYAGLTTPNIYPAGYVRISQISFSYYFPERWIRKIKFTRLGITLFANNPILWTKYPGIDPESNFAGPGNAQGEEWFNNPGTKSYGVRLNIGL